jgi:rubredoxin
MTPARKLGYRRRLNLVPGMVLGFVAAGLIREWIANGQTIAAASAAILIVVVTAWMVYFTFFWGPICPECRNRRAHFVFQGKLNERLVCPACGFDEPTGFKNVEGSDW